MSEEEASWLEKFYYFLERSGGYEVVNCLLEADKPQKVIVEESGGPESTVHMWLQAAASVGLVVEQGYGRFDGSVSVIWSLDDEKIPDEAIPIIQSRGSEWRGDNDIHINTPSINHYDDDYDLREVLGLEGKESFFL